MAPKPQRYGVIAAQQANSSIATAGGGGYGSARNPQRGQGIGDQSTAGCSYVAPSTFLQPGSGSGGSSGSYWDHFMDQGGSQWQGSSGGKSAFRRRAAPAVRSRPLGMTNLGNTCYMNATLQVLCASLPRVCLAALLPCSVSY